MITKSDIEKTIKDLNKGNRKIVVRDISYCLLYFEYENAEIAYRSVFDQSATKAVAEKYDSSAKIKALKKYILENFKTKEEEPEQIIVPAKNKKLGDDIPDMSDITFEENKAELVKMLEEIDDAIREKRIAYKDGKKMQVEIRSKLNDKFKVSGDSVQQYVIVEKKFNYICPYLRKECYLYTKEDLIEKYGLVDRKELEKKFKLIPR